MENYIYTREYGLQTKILGFNFRVVNQAVGKSVGQFLRPNISAGSVQVISEKSFSVNSFFGLKQITFEKKGDAVFVEPVFDFNRFKIKVSGVPNYPFGNKSVNIYDREAIKRIIQTYVTTKVDEVFNLFYQSISNQENATQTVYRATEILELCFEYGNDIFKIIDQAKTINQIPPTYSENTAIGTVSTTQPQNSNGTNTINSGQTTTNKQNKYLLPIGILIALVVAKKKKWL